MDRFLFLIFQIASWAILLLGAALAGGGFVLLVRMFGYDWAGWIVAVGWFAVVGGAAFLGWASCTLAARLADAMSRR